MASPVLSVRTDHCIPFLVDLEDEAEVVVLVVLVVLAVVEVLLAVLLYDLA